MGLVNGSDVECENQRGGKVDSKVGGLSIWMNGVSVLRRTLMGEKV